MDSEVTPAEPARSGPDRALLAIVIAIVAIVIVALVVVLSRGTAPQLDASTPEGVVQRYAQAVADNDFATAVVYLVPENRDDCSDYYGATYDTRLTFVDTVISGDRATVTVSITSSYGFGLFGESSSSYEQDFSLTERDGDWLIDDAPYEYIACD